MRTVKELSVLFFHEFDLPLKKIKSIMNDPALDKKQILKMQREMLTGGHIISKRCRRNRCRKTMQKS